MTDVATGRENTQLGASWSSVIMFHLPRRSESKLSTNLGQWKLSRVIWKWKSSPPRLMPLWQFKRQPAYATPLCYIHSDSDRLPRYAMWMVTVTAAGGHSIPEIGQGSPMEWLLRSPDLALMDLFRREFVKNNVYGHSQWHYMNSRHGSERPVQKLVTKFPVTCGRSQILVWCCSSQ